VSDLTRNIDHPDQHRTGMIDAASIRMAETLLAKLEQIEARATGDDAGVSELRQGAGA